MAEGPVKSVYNCLGMRHCCRLLNFGLTPFRHMYLPVIFPERLVRRQISRIDMCSRKCQRRSIFSNAMPITSELPQKSCEG